MAFSAEARVKVSNQHSEFRNAYGVVKTVVGDGTYGVRLDGYPAAGRTTFNGEDLIASTQDVPIEY